MLLPSAGDSKRLSAAIDAAEEAGVEKLLIKKAKTALQALRKKGRSLGEWLYCHRMEVCDREIGDVG